MQVASSQASLSLRALRNELHGGFERLRRRHCHVGSDTRAFPVGLRDRIYRAREGHTDRELIIDPLAACWICAAAGLLADNRRALQCLEVVAELLGGRKRDTGGENVDWLLPTVLPPRHVGIICPRLIRPELVR